MGQLLPVQHLTSHIHDKHMRTVTVPGSDFQSLRDPPIPNILALLFIHHETKVGDVTSFEPHLSQSQRGNNDSEHEGL